MALEEEAEDPAAAAAPCQAPTLCSSHMGWWSWSLEAGSLAVSLIYCVVLAKLFNIPEP